MEISIGSTVGGYVLQEKLGEGGMGAVYRARHRTLPKDVALKVLLPAYASMPEFRERFLREAEVLCRLEHPNIVDVSDRGQDGDLLWMTMRYVPGPSLADAISDRGPLAPSEAVSVAEAIGQALDHAHAQGLLHRDVKPPNILLRADWDGREHPMLADFGIAKDLAAAHALTQHSQGPATLAYAAPEQLTARAPLDGRIDVYALGAVVFECLTGRRAYPAEDPLALMWSIVDGPVPDVRTLRPEMPDHLAVAVGRALAKDPADRFPSCGAFAEAAGAALAGAAPAPPTVLHAPRDPSPPPGQVPPPPAVPAPSAEVEGPTRPQTRVPALPPAPAQGRRKVVLAGVLLAVLALAGVLLAVWLTPPVGGSGAEQSESSESTPTVTSASGAPSTGATVVSVGTCLDGNSVVTTCDGEHASEVFTDAGDCRSEELLSYLGGAPGADVLRTGLTVSPLPAALGPGCTVSGPDGPLTASSRDVLLGPAGDAWRRCEDELGREVSCAGPHRAEVIFEQTTASDPLNCAGRADDYLETPFQPKAEDLELVEDGPRCVIEVRGQNVLTASLRRLRSNALPIEAAPN